MNIAVFFRQGNELIRKYNPQFIVLQAHQRFRRVILSDPDVVYRLAVYQHPRIARIPLCGNVRQFLQDDFILAVFVQVVRLNPVNRVLRNPGMNAANKTDVFVFPAQFLRAVPDDNFIVIAEMLIFNSKLLQDSSGSFFIVRVPANRNHQHHMAVAHLEKRGTPVIGFRHMTDQGAHLF